MFLQSNDIPKEARTLDLNKYSGKWYVIACIPTRFDKKWEYITESYHLNSRGTIDIFTTYKKGSDTTERSVTSKGYLVKGKHNMKWKVQFIWPFRADYLVEELPEDYSYVVVGHPKKKFLYIMNRSGLMSAHREREIIESCREKGYDVTKLRKVKQEASGQFQQAE